MAAPRWRPAHSSCLSINCSRSQACREKSRRSTYGFARPRPARRQCSTCSGRRRRSRPPYLVCAPFLRRERASNNQFVVLAHAAAWGTSSIALLIGILGIANTMAMSVFERTREIGILRALGWKRWRVLLLIQMEAAVLGFAGGVIGIAAGWAALRALSTLPQTASIVSASFPLLLLPEALGIAVLAGLAAGAIPAWRGARLSPVEALRHD